jgi:hypothetical protein
MSGRRMPKPDRENKSRFPNARKPPTTMSVGSLWDALNAPNRHATPESTIEAIMVAVRARGVAALREPANVERLLRCDPSALAEINRRIEKIISENGDA